MYIFIFFEEDHKYCKVVDCENDLAEKKCPQTCSESRFCKIVDCTKPESTKLCPETCAKRPNEDLGKNKKWTCGDIFWNLSG